MFFFFWRLGQYRLVAFLLLVFVIGGSQDGFGGGYIFGYSYLPLVFFCLFGICVFCVVIFFFLYWVCFLVFL